jgi:hypothetical protein
LNHRLIKLVEIWKAIGSPKQEGFNWTSRRENWIEAFPQEAKFIAALPEEIDRDAVRNVCNSKKIEILQKFLAVMIWGYGDRGYGPYRVRQMINQDHALAVLTRVYALSQEGNAKDAYDFLRQNRIRILGPSYGSKFISFCTPREVGAPIYDSLVAMWVEKFASKEFSGVTTSCENWNLKTYSKYLDWIKEHSDELDCYPDEIELVLFRDAERKFSKSSNWSEK